MSGKVKSALAVVFESLAVAAGYALVLVGIYVVVFVDVTGGGSLWNSVRRMQELSREGGEPPRETQVVRVAAQTSVAKVHEDRILSVFDDAPKDGTVAAVYQAPESGARRSEAELTAIPAEPISAKTGKRSAMGTAGAFTVYGDREPAVSSTPVKGVAGRGKSRPAPVAARPGVSSQLSHGLLSDPDASRNVR